MNQAITAVRAALAVGLLAGISAPALAHEPILRCALLDEKTVRCRGGYGHGEGATDANFLTIDHGEKIQQAEQLSKDSTLTFPRPNGAYYVMFDAGPGDQVIVEHDGITRTGSRDRARWMPK